jgi:hypothetical protein
MAKKKQPTTTLDKAEDLYEICQDTIDKYATRDSNLDNLEDYYFAEGDQEETPGEEEGIEVVRLPHGETTVSLVQDLFSALDWSISVPALSEKQSDKRLAEDAEAFLRATFRQSERMQRQDLLGRAAWIVAMRGACGGRVMAVDRWMKDGDEWTIKDKVPLLMQLRDVRYLYPGFGIDGLAHMTEKWKRTVKDIRNTYGDEMLPKLKPTDEVDWCEYWDKKQYCYWAGGEVVAKADSGMVGPWPHTYGGVPYSYEFARQTGKTEPEKRARPLLQGLQAVIDRMNLLDSMEMTFVAHYLGTSWQFETEDGTAADVDLRPGAVNPVHPGESIKPIQAGIKPLALDQARAKMEAMFERGTFPTAMYGTDPGKVMAGYAITLLQQAGQARLESMLKCLQLFLESMCCNALMVAEKHVQKATGKPLPFYIYSDIKDEGKGARYRGREEKTFDAEGLGGFYYVEISLGDLLKADQQSNVMLAERLRNPGTDGRPLLSDETIRQTFKLTDAEEEERDRIDRQYARQLSEVQKLTMALQSVDLLRDLQERLKKAKVDPSLALQQVGQGGQQPTPPEQNIPPPVEAQQPPPAPEAQQPAMLPPEMMPAAMQGQPMPQPGMEAGMEEPYPIPPVIEGM